MRILVISGDEGGFRVTCHLWDNLLPQLAQNLYSKLLAARGESDKEGRSRSSLVSRTLPKPGKARLP